jgi:protein-tyrosine phosphatase
MENDRATPGFKQALRRVVPGALLRERQIILRLGPKAGGIYARLRLLDSLGVRLQTAGTLGPQTRSVVFVCFGNIMRSPMAEVLLRAAAPAANLADLQVSSAGVHAIPGSAAHPWALAASAEMGVPLTEHRSRLLTPEMVAQADAIFAMDFQNMAELLALYPEAKSKVLMVTTFLEGAQRGREIADPYFGNLDTTRACYAMLQACMGALTKELVVSRATYAQGIAPSKAPVR